MTRRLGALVVVLIGVGLLAGCGSGSGGTTPAVADLATLAASDRHRLLPHRRPLGHGEEGDGGRGFTDVPDLEGPIIAWSRAGKPVVVG